MSDARAAYLADAALNLLGQSNWEGMDVHTVRQEIAQHKATKDFLETTAPLLCVAATLGGGGHTKKLALSASARTLNGVRGAKLVAFTKRSAERSLRRRVQTHPSAPAGSQKRRRTSR